MASQGYVPEAVNDKSYGGELADGVIVALGIGTSSEGSPAVDLNMSFRRKGLETQLLSPRSTKRDIASFGGTCFEMSSEIGCNWNDEMAKAEPSSWSRTNKRSI